MTGWGTFARQAVAYSVGGVAGKVLAIATVPILARLLSPAELGLIDTASLTATIASVLIGVGLDNATARFHSPARVAGTLWATVLAVVAVTGSAVLVIALVLREPLARLVLSDADEQSLVALAIVYGCAIAVMAVGLNVIRLRAGGRAYAVAATAALLAQTVVAVIAAAVAPDPVATTIALWAALSFLTGVIAFRRYGPRLGRPDPALARQLLRFGAPLVLSALAWTVGDVGVRAALAHDLSVGAIGQFGIASRIVSVMALAVAGFSLAWWPFISREASGGAPVVRGRQALLVTAAGLGAAAVALAGVAPELFAILAGPAYSAGAAAVAPMAGGMVAFGCLTVLAGVAGVAYQTARVALVSLAGMALQIVSALVLVRELGIAGAAVASLSGYALATLGLGLWLRGIGMTGVQVMSLLAVFALTAGMLALDAVALGSGWPSPLRYAASALGVVSVVAIGGLGYARFFAATPASSR